MSKASIEEIKLESLGLRGVIAENFADAALTHVGDSENVLLKFHGSYQQDDRDKRAALTKEKKEKAWSFMVRSKMPGGRITAGQCSSITICACFPKAPSALLTVRESSSTACSKATSKQSSPASAAAA